MLLCGIVEAIIITVWAWLGIVSTSLSWDFYNPTAAWANSALGCSIPI